jgi:phage replication O-like protein O
MASPQKENGYTAIANEIIEALARTRIPGEARQVLDVVIRLTYGWNRKYRQITYPEFTTRTKLNKGNVRRSLVKLIRHCLIERCEQGYCFQKDYEKWLPFPRKGVVNSDYPVVKDDYQRVVNTDYPPESIMTTGAPGKPSNGNGSREPKDSIKDSLKKTLSLEREVLEKKLRKLFPSCISIPKGISTEKLWLFLYKIGRGEIQKDSIRSPVSYMKGMLDEDIQALLDQETAAKQQKADDEKRRQKEKEEQHRLREENQEEMKGLISSFVAELEGQSAVGV